jgi:putative transposase
VLDAYLFDDLAHLLEITAAWLKTYNENRPHDALGRQPPAVFRALIETRNSTSELST